MLDIGTGSGQYALAFARTVEGIGTIYATDISGPAINFLKQESEKEGLDAIVPLVVQNEGLDPFYKEHRFDVVFIAHAHYYINDRVAYFKGLKESINPGGKLAILGYKSVMPIQMTDVTSWKGLIKTLVELIPEDPFYPKFESIIMDINGSANRQEVSVSIKKSVVEKLNEISLDPCFSGQFFNDLKLKEEVAVTPAEGKVLRYFRRFLTLEDQVLDNQGCADLNGTNFNAKHYFMIKTINLTMVVQKFRQFLFVQNPPPYLPGGSDPSLHMQKLQRDMAVAGFSLETAHDFIPYEILFIFKPR